MRRYRKKPVVIEAVWYHGGSDSLIEAINFIGQDFLGDGPDGRIFIRTLEGEHAASPGDFIIKGVAGEFYPCKPDVFEATYEAVNDE